MCLVNRMGVESVHTTLWKRQKSNRCGLCCKKRRKKKIVMYNYVNKRTIIRGLQGDVAFDLSLDLWKDFSQLRGRGASLVAQMVKCLPAMQETRVPSQVGKIPWRKKWQPTPVLLPGKFHGWSSLVG